ncbi:hypothetical protein HID58_028002 [Brassica napus]|uniref:Uncharacterized protein n=1 Tax=Brassica napus TaxID=3708 RepID=A0ABQ8CTB8_BRANA|nr:hypothetical protein HID58_028002 [Brassica napus]
MAFDSIVSDSEELKSLKLYFMSDKISPFCYLPPLCLENNNIIILHHPELRTTTTTSSSITRIFKPETPPLLLSDHFH